ncbi:MAG: chorismate lyase [Gammaproteobacteria bacterium]|nr:chorismate lyase [Gammaproteobacteria bacterium]
MRNHYNSLARHACWWAETNLIRERFPEAIHSLLFDKGSLTASLVDLSDHHFQVRVLGQQRRVPLLHEQRKMQRPLHRISMVREVELLMHGEPVVYARSIIPISLLNKSRSGLANLGSTPLGHLLFRDGRIRVSKREFALIENSEGLFCARRTPYDYLGSQILVSEFFLPDLLKKVSASAC